MQVVVVGRMQVVVVVIRELLFLVTSVICVWIRGSGSEVTTAPYHFCSHFRPQLCSYRSEFIVLFPRYLSVNIKLLGILCSLATYAQVKQYFELCLVILLFFWHENATTSFLPLLSSMAACRAEQ